MSCLVVEGPRINMAGIFDSVNWLLSTILTISPPPRVKTPKIAVHVVKLWRSQDPPGHFLARTDPNMRDESYWHDIGDKEAKKKCSQCLREKTADVAPILKKLGEEQEIEEEKMKKKMSPKREPKKSVTKTTPTKPKEVTPTKDKSKEGKLKKMKEAQEAKEKPYATMHEARGSRGSPSQSSLSRSNRDRLRSSAPAAVSGRVGPRLSLVKEKKSRNIREEVSISVPSAASLVEATFDEEDSESEQEDSLDSASLLPNDLREIMHAPSIGNMSDSLGSFSNDLSMGMEHLSTSSSII